jgi:dienelactone hydrolase
MVQTSHAAVSAPVTLHEGGQDFRGDLFVPKSAKGTLPLVVVVPEWWGKNDYPVRRGREIADKLGYAALVVDLYGAGKTTESAKEAQELSGPFYKNQEMGVKRLQSFIAAAAAAHIGEAKIDPTKIAAIGYCFGGAQVLNLAREDALPEPDKLLGVVSFHGGLSTTLQDKKPIKAKILVLHGADDKFVSADEVGKFKAEMKDAQADMTFIAYPGATHAFSNPNATKMGKKNNIPIAYNAKAAEESWREMTGFLKKLFGG